MDSFLSRFRLFPQAQQRMGTERKVLKKKIGVNWWFVILFAGLVGVLVFESCRDRGRAAAGVCGMVSEREQGVISSRAWHPV